MLALTRSIWRRSPVLVPALILLFAGCAPAVVVEDPVAPAEYPHHTAAQIVANVHLTAADDAIAAYASNARISIRSPNMNADGTAVLRQRGSDTLWASIRGPLNVEVMRALVTQDTFRVHDRLQNRLYVGPPEAAQRLFPGPLGLDDVSGALTGTTTPDAEGHWFANASTLDGVQIYWLTARDGRTRIAVDPVLWRVRRYERLARDGSVVDRRLFASFENVEGRMLPHRIELGNPAEETFLTVEHRRLDLNPPILSFPFDPSGATVVPIGEFGPPD